MTQIKMAMDPYFFGYGSLVNRWTHDYPDARPARAQGWRRVWRHITNHRGAVLTAVPDPGTTIEGLVAAVPGADWQALDTREAGYDRVDAAEQIAHDLSPTTRVAIYTIPATKHPAAPGPQPVLLSYLDVVIQGYLREFGEEGALRFFDTTDNWGPVRDDRVEPLYPRHQRLTADERAFVDDQLSSRGIERL